MRYSSLTSSRKFVLFPPTCYRRRASSGLDAQLATGVQVPPASRRAIAVWHCARPRRPRRPRCHLRGGLGGFLNHDSRRAARFRARTRILHTAKGSYPCRRRRGSDLLNTKRLWAVRTVTDSWITAVSLCLPVDNGATTRRVWTACPASSLPRQHLPPRKACTLYSGISSLSPHLPLARAWVKSSSGCETDSCRCRTSDTS